MIVVRPERRRNMIVLKRKYEKDGKQYEAYAGSGREEALAFLRGREVKDEGFYISVVTPSGTFGRDLLEIYDERTQERIEIPKRSPLPRLVKSLTRCARCGYTVLPISKEVLPKVDGPLEAVIPYDFDFQEEGLGYVCSDCQTVWCAHCTGTHGHEATCGICRKPMPPLEE
jgi:hypothetical protein